MMGATATSSTTGIVSLLLVLLLCHHYVRAFSTFSSLPTTTVPSYSYTTVSNRSTRLSTTSLYAKKKNLKSFVRYLEIECWKRAELRELEPVLQAVAESCKQINKLVQRAQTDDLYGVALGADGLPLEDTNIQGEVQQQLDVLCNTMMLRAFCGCSSSIHSVASEEEDEPRCCSDVMVRVNVASLVFGCCCRFDFTDLPLWLGFPILSVFLSRLIQHLLQVIIWQYLIQLMVPKILIHHYQSVVYLVSTGNHNLRPPKLIHHHSYKMVVP